MYQLQATFLPQIIDRATEQQLTKFCGLLLCLHLNLRKKLQRNSLQSLVKEFLQGAAVFYKDGLCKDIGC